MCCTGTLRLHGTKDNLLKFLEERIQMTGTYIDEKDKQVQDVIEISPDGVYLESTYPILIRNTNALIVEGYVSWGFDPSSDIQSVAIDISGRHDIESQDLLDIATVYHLDLRIYAFDQEEEFTHEIEILNGHITRNIILKLKDYIWECICPFLCG